MKITKEMVDEFNELLAKEGCIFKLKFIEMNEKYPEHKLYNPEMKIVPANDKYLWNHSKLIIEANKEFYEFAESFFQSKGIELEYNEVGSNMWSKYGLKDVFDGIDNSEDECEISSGLQSGMELL